MSQFHDHPPSHTGVWLAVTAAVLFGVGTPLAKGLLASTAPPILAGLLYMGSGIGLSLLRLADRRASAAEAPLTGGDWPWLAGATVFGGLFGPLLLMAGLQLLPSSRASLLLNLEGVLTALLAWVVFQENVDRRVATGMA
jgi:drug/metabolite transporter (DMT)-like permease